MEIEDIRKELNHLLNSVVEHSSKYSDARPIPSLEISFVLTKINKMQENLVILKHLLKEQEISSKRFSISENVISIPKESSENLGEVDKIDSSLKEDEDLEKSNLEEPSIYASISNLKDALTLNDRYLYANELFNKDMEAFSELVKSIDNSSTISEANDLLSSFEWDDENEHVLSFNMLIKRRFS